MANLSELAKSYVPMLDEVYKLASCTSDLDEMCIRDSPHTVVCKGGRGSTKSSFVGIALVILLLQHPQ